MMKIYIFSNNDLEKMLLYTCFAKISKCINNKKNLHNKSIILGDIIIPSIIVIFFYY